MSNTFEEDKPSGEQESLLSTNSSPTQPIHAYGSKSDRSSFSCYFLTLIVILISLICGGYIYNIDSAEASSQSLTEPNTPPPLKASHLTHRENLCIDNYVKALRTIDTRGKSLRPFVDEMERSMKREWKGPQSNKRIIIGNGCGTTATHAAAIALWKLGLNVAHWRYVHNCEFLICFGNKLHPVKDEFTCKKIASMT